MPCQCENTAFAKEAAILLRAAAAPTKEDVPKERVVKRLRQGTGEERGRRSQEEVAAHSEPCSTLQPSRAQLPGASTHVPRTVQGL